MGKNKQRPPKPGPSKQPPALEPGALVQPSPLITGVGHVRQHLSDGQPYVLMRTETVVGTLMLMMTPEHARQVAAQLTAEADRAKSTLDIVQPGLVVPR